jgi:hypothetical protein
MSSLSTRLAKLEEQQPSVCMVAMENLDGSFDWDGNIYRDHAALCNAHQASGLDGPLITLDFRIRRHKTQG